MRGIIVRCIFWGTLGQSFQNERTAFALHHDAITIGQGLCLIQLTVNVDLN